MVKNLSSNAGDVGSIPGQGTKIPHATKQLSPCITTREPIHCNKDPAAKLLQSCPTLCNPRDSSPPASPVPGILQARTLKWVAISFSNAWKWKVKVKSLSHVWLWDPMDCVAYQAPPSMGFSRQEYWSGMPLSSLTQRSLNKYLQNEWMNKGNKLVYFEVIHFCDT